MLETKGQRIQRHKDKAILQSVLRCYRTGNYGHIFPNIGAEAFILKPLTEEKARLEYITYLITEPKLSECPTLYINFY